MRKLILALTLLALPAAVAAQDAGATADVLPAPTVELQQATTPGVTAPATASSPEQAAAGSATVEEDRTETAEPAADVQAPTKQWWYLVGAIVAAGIILAVLL